MKKERVDKLIANRGLAESPEKAQALVMAGLVYSEGRRVEKPGQRLDVNQEIFLKDRIPYVSRGGLKLEGALEAFKIIVQGKAAADLGSSTGGFTDCLLQKGARKVYAVDVDTKQLDRRLREDPRVVCVEKNARYLKKDDFEDLLDIVTLDLSFISILKVLPALKEFIADGRLISLIKPQFEAGRGQVGKKGVIRDPDLHQQVLKKVIDEARRMGFFPEGLTESPVRGQRGNREFFVLWSMAQEPLKALEVENLIKEAVRDEKD